MVFPQNLNHRQFRIFVSFPLDTGHDLRAFFFRENVGHFAIYDFQTLPLYEILATRFLFCET